MPANSSSYCQRKLPEKATQFFWEKLEMKIPKQLFHHKRSFKVSVTSCNNSIISCLKAYSSNDVRHLISTLIE